MTGQGGNRQVKERSGRRSAPKHGLSRLAILGKVRVSAIDDVVPLLSKIITTDDDTAAMGEVHSVAAAVIPVVAVPVVVGLVLHC